MMKRFFESAVKHVWHQILRSTLLGKDAQKLSEDD
jgi:hypothetical protein